MAVVSKRQMWVESICVASEYGCKEVYIFPYITYPYSLCICSFCNIIPTFCSHYKKVFLLYNCASHKLIYIMLL